MGLASPFSAILSAVISTRSSSWCSSRSRSRREIPPLGAALLLRRQPAHYGLGGILIPFAGIKLIDLTLVMTHLV